MSVHDDIQDAIDNAYDALVDLMEWGRQLEDDDMERLAGQAQDLVIKIVNPA